LPYLFPGIQATLGAWGRKRWAKAVRILRPWRLTMCSPWRKGKPSDNLSRRAV
jgi:hypothetical protein